MFLLQQVPFYLQFLSPNQHKSHSNISADQSGHIYSLQQQLLLMRWMYMYHNLGQNLFRSRHRNSRKYSPNLFVTVSIPHRALILQISGLKSCFLPILALKSPIMVIIHPSSEFVYISVISESQKKLVHNYPWKNFLEVSNSSKACMSDHNGANASIVSIKYYPENYPRQRLKNAAEECLPLQIHAGPLLMFILFCPNKV